MRFHILVMFGDCGHLVVYVPNQFSFSHLGFWNGIFFLIAAFPDHCLLVPFFKKELKSSLVSFFS